MQNSLMETAPSFLQAIAQTIALFSESGALLQQINTRQRVLAEVIEQSRATAQEARRLQARADLLFVELKKTFLPRA